MIPFTRLDVHQIRGDWTTNTEDKSIGLDNQSCCPPYLYHASSNNQHLALSPISENDLQTKVFEFSLLNGGWNY